MYSSFSIYTGPRQYLLIFCFVGAKIFVSQLPLTKKPKDLSGLEAQMFDNFLRSDHRMFWNENLKAIFLTDTANYRGRYSFRVTNFIIEHSQNYYAVWAVRR